MLLEIDNWLINQSINFITAVLILDQSNISQALPLRNILTYMFFDFLFENKRYNFSGLVVICIIVAVRLQYTFKYSGTPTVHL